MKDEDFKNLSAESLVGLVRKSHEKIMADAEKREKELKKKVAELSAQEKGLKEKITSAKDIHEKMIESLENLEQKEKDEILAKIQKDAVTQEDVKSGKATMNQFFTASKKSDELKRELMEKNQGDLEKASDVVRAKGEEVIRLERDLYETQNTIHGLLAQPIRLIKSAYKEALDVLDYQSEQFGESGHLSQTLKSEAENKIMLIEKEVGMSSGYAWTGITLGEAYRVRFDPVLPKRLVSSLQQKLNELDGDEETRVTITYHSPGSFWPGDEIEVRDEK